jgi:hypothetical protein
MSALSAWRYARAEQEWQEVLRRKAAAKRRTPAPSSSAHSNARGVPAPVERRPIESPAEARAAALESIRFTDGEAAYARAMAKLRSRPKPSKPRRVSSTNRRKARATTSVSYIEIARAKRARHGERRRQRTQAEIAALGAKGEAHKAFDGSWHFPVANEEDLRDAIKAIGRARPAERWAIRKFLIGRARALGLSHLIPSNWTASGALEGQPHPTQGPAPKARAR